MKYCRVSILTLLLVFGSTSAGEPAADLSISAAVAPSGVTPPGTEGVVTITVTNIGPDESTPLFSMRRTDDGTGVFDFPPLHFQFPGALLTGRCVTVPVPLPPAGEFLIWIIPHMTAGETVECTYAFTVADTSTVAQVAEWGVGRFSGPDDPNNANNVAGVLLRFAESPEPVSVKVFSPWGLLVLLLLLGSISVCGLARRSKSSVS